MVAAARQAALPAAPASWWFHEGAAAHVGPYVMCAAGRIKTKIAALHCLAQV